MMTVRLAMAMATTGRHEAVPLRLSDPLRSRAVLVGPTSYRHLTPLPAVGNNLRRLEALFTSPEVWGLPDRNCVVLDEPTSVEEVLDSLLVAGEQATDTLVFYFAGHGLLDPETSDLFLALGDADVAPIQRAVRWVDVQRYVVHHERPSNVVILDCCYSGRAMAGAMSDAAQLADLAQIDGSYVLTACSETNLAMAPEGEEFTAFTGVLVDVLDAGIPDAPDLLDTETVYWRLRTELAAARRPTPQQRSRNAGNRIVLARNRARRPAEPRPVEGRPATSVPTSPTPVEPSKPSRQPRLTPAELVTRRTELRNAGNDSAADELLDSASARRPAQETASIVGLLYAVPAVDDADRVLNTAVRRGASAASALLTVLKALERHATLRRAFEFLARCDTAYILGVAQRLPDADRDDLLHMSALARFGRPDQMINLVGALSAAGGAGLRNRLLNRIARAISPHDAAALADALREAGHDVAAFRLYETAEEALATRPVAETVLIAAAMHKAHHQAQAVNLLDRVSSACQTAEQYAALLNALAQTELPDGVSHDALTDAAATLPDAEVIRLARDLAHHDHDARALSLLAAAAAQREIQHTVTYVQASLSAGRPMDVLALARATATRSARDILVLLHKLILSGADAAANALLDATIDTAASKIVEVIAYLANARLSYLLRPITERLDARNLSLVLTVALGLIRADRRPIARTVLAGCPQALAGPVDADTRIRFTALTLPPHPSGPAGIVLEGLIDEVRVVRAPIPRRRSWTQEAATPEPAVPPRRPRPPPAPYQVVGSDIRAPAWHDAGLTERAQLIVDLVCAVPAIAVRLPSLADGGDGGAPQVFADRLLDEPVDLAAMVLARLHGTELTAYSEAILDRAGRLGNIGRWCVELSNSVHSARLVEQYLRSAAERGSCRSIAHGLIEITEGDDATGLGKRAIGAVKQHTPEARRMHVAHFLAQDGHPKLAAALLDMVADDPFTPEHASAVWIVRRALKQPTFDGLLHPGDPPGLATMQLGSRYTGAVVTFTREAVSYRRLPVWREERIEYHDLAGATFRPSRDRLQLHRPGRFNTYWHVGRHNENHLALAAALLNAIATAVRKVSEVDPETPAPSAEASVNPPTAARTRRRRL